MENADKRKEEIASEFIVCTRQLLPKLCSSVYGRIRATIASSKYLMFCGSCEEFYIRPPNPCVSDLDILTCSTNMLAFVEDFPVLPNDVSGLADTITCYKLKSCLRYPGFVALRELGKMNYNWKYKIFEFSHTAFPNRHVKPDMAANATEPVLPAKYRFETSEAFKGPAVMFYNSSSSLTCDSVRCVWCPQWPREVQNWPKRRRDYGWPTNDTISEVVQHGCHVVYVQHRACRNDGAQWRLSFSVAEVILLQSWTKIQQIVYHLLRFFAKRELLQKDCPKEDEVLCTYHLKTMMLWTCEEMSPEWWNSSSVIIICCKLLQKLSELLKSRYFPNYFIPEANLFHEPSSSKMLNKTEMQLNEFRNSGILCNWFEENYILPLTRTHCKTTMPHFTDCILPLFEFIRVSESQSIDVLFHSGSVLCHEYAYNTMKFEITAQPSSHFIYTCLKENRAFFSLRNLALPGNVRCFTYTDITVYSLNIAYGLGCGKIAWDSDVFAEFVKGISFEPKNVRCQYHTFPEPFSAEGSQIQYLRAQDLMENLTGLNSRSEFQVLCLMSREFLRKALECDDCQSDTIALAALVYLAALHFASSEYQIVMDLCSDVLIDQTTHAEDETLNAGCLFFIDAVVRIVGFCLLCKKLNQKMCLTKRQIYLDLRLTPKVFAYYLTVISSERMYKQMELNSHLPTPAFFLDKSVLVHARQKSRMSMKSTTTCFKAARQCVYRRIDLLTSSANLRVNSLKLTEKLIDALTEYALENMTSFYSVIFKDFGIRCNILSDCYRALYLYKYRQYDEVLQLCERILHEPDLRSDLKEFGFANVLVIPPFDYFFDGDVQSLLGLHTLVYYLSPLNDDMGRFELTTDSTFAHWFARFIYMCCFKRQQLLDSLIFHYSIKCHYFLGRHFLRDI